VRRHRLVAAIRETKLARTTDALRIGCLDGKRLSIADSVAAV
jgi:hypothetical protein